jgi:DNA primase
MEHEKYSYVEALRWLAQRYNIELEETQVSAEQLAIRQQADSLYIINQFAQQFFADILLNSEEGRDIGLSYLRERGFTEETIRKFQLGFNPEARNQFAQAAIKGQYNTELLIKSGLVVSRNDELVDNYRGRIIFPIHNQSGKVLGFGARIIKTNDRAPKYINTPENEIYVKSKILYGSYFARQTIDRLDECLLVEGYTDVISLHQAGIENVVASGGTALTIDQLRLIKKYTNNLTIIYDGDAAGVKAALRGLDLALEERLNVKLVLIPDKEDPDSYVRKVGADAFQAFIQTNKKDFIFFQLEVMMSEAGNDTQKKTALVNQLAETISRINQAEDFSKQQDYIRRSAEYLKIDEGGLLALVNKFMRDRVLREQNKARDLTDTTATPTPLTEEQPSTEQSDVAALLQRDRLQERGLVRVLLEFGHLPWDDTQSAAQYIYQEIEENQLIDMLNDPELPRILDQYNMWMKEGLEPTAKNFLYHEDMTLGQFVVNLMDFPYELSDRWQQIFEGKLATREQLYREEVASTLNYLKLRKTKHLIEENQRELEHEKDPQQQMNLLLVHRHLKEVESELSKALGTVIWR